MLRLLVIFILFVVGCSHPPSIAAKFAEQDQLLQQHAASLAVMQKQLRIANEEIKAGRKNLEAVRERMVYLREAYRRITRHMDAIDRGTQLAMAEIEAGITILESKLRGY